MLHKLFLVNQSLKLAVMQNTHVSKTKLDETLIDQIQWRMYVEGNGGLYILLAFTNKAKRSNENIPDQYIW